ncbi:MAG: Gfo/Idh/MocA family oxidoreductase [Phycisphaerae bacterium]|nr:Gfo/Idh/MocA family oxidoreductase [Phycisphaerae bacterium]
MRKVTRREFVKGGLAAGLALGWTRSARSAGSSSEVRLAIVGLGGIDVPGSVGGRGRQLIDAFRKVPGARIVTLCDVDQAILEHGAALMKKAGTTVTACTDLRRVLDDKNVDAVVVALPNHWHALAAVWACQAGKDVYVEKPLAYNIWEGRQIVAAAQKYGRIVQVGTQSRSSSALREAGEFVRSGQMGKPRYAHAVVYRSRASLGKVAGPTPVPPTVDYNLWSGPAPLEPIHRKQLHYEWHWFWTYGNGEIGNNGPHYLDVCRWMLGVNEPPRHALSIGGRFLFDDDGETPNTHITLLDCEPASILCEIRGLPEDKKPAGSFRGLKTGVLIQCEGGYLRTDLTGGTAFDNQDQEIKKFAGPKPNDMVVTHVTNFVEAVRSRNAGQLHAPALEGHLSTACAHIANVSHRLGAESNPEAIRAAIQKAAPTTEAAGVFADVFERYQQYLAANGVARNAAPGVLGAWVTLDSASERFVGAFADQANAIATREYRAPFVVPTVA